MRDGLINVIEIGLVVLLIVFSAQNSEALNEIATIGETVPLEPLLDHVIHTPTAVIKDLQIDKKNLSVKAFTKSHDGGFTLGKIKKHKLNLSHAFAIPIFIIGKDEESLKWAKENAGYFKQLGALGLIANINRDAQLKKAQKETDLLLVPANLNGLSSLLGIDHYPVLIKDGWAMQ